MRTIGIALIFCLATSATALADGTDITVPDKIQPVKPKPTAAKKRRPPAFSGSNAPKSAYRTEPLPKPSGDLWITAPNLGGEEVHVQIYKKDGSFDNAALAKLDDLFRCAATGEVRAIRAELYEQLSRVQDHFGNKKVEMYSAFRYTDRTSSRHYHASAMDFKIPGVSIYEIQKFAATLDTGNMGLGIYPTSGFIHLDVRAPGEPSFRWTDYSGPGQGPSPKRKPTGRTQPARKPVS